MEYEVALLIFGVLLLLVGLVGKVKAQELEVGTEDRLTRLVVGFVGAVLIALSLLLSPASGLLSRWAGGNQVADADAENAEPEPTPERDSPGDTDAPVDEVDVAEAPDTIVDGRIAIISAKGVPGDGGTEVLGAFVGALKRVSHDNLQQLGIGDFDLVLVMADTSGVWSEMSRQVLRALFKGKKVVGLGSGGAELFQALGAAIGRGRAMHGPGQHEVVLAHFPSGYVGRPDLPEKFVAYEPGGSDVLGIHDGGSPALRGFEAFAHWPDAIHHWPVLRQGNLLLWGFDAPLETLTEEGRTLLLALMQDHIARPYVAFEDRLPDIDVVPPGTHRERLTAQFPSHTWHIQPARPGRIVATVRFDQALGPLALILNGPGQVGFHERTDGNAPLELGFEITKELLERGDTWRVSVTKFGALPQPIDYQIVLDFPN